MRLARAFRLAVRPSPLAADGCDGVGVRRGAILEELVEAAVGELPTRPGESLELEAKLLVGEQAPLGRLGFRVGRQQTQRGEVVTGDPRGRAGIQDVRAVKQVQREIAAALGHDQAQHGAVRRVAVPAGRVEDGLERALR